MAVTWEEADAELISLAERLIRENHAHLLDAKIGFMYRSEAAQSGNKKKLGSARKVSEEQQVFIDFDFVIWIAKKEFEDAEDEEWKAALVDHELCHCSGAYGDWKMRHHDFEEFSAVIVRHGLWRSDLAFAAKAFENAGKGQQALFFPDERGSVASVPKIEIKRFAGAVELMERAKTDPGEVAIDLFKAAQLMREENGGTLSISQLQRKFRIGYSHAKSIFDMLEAVSGKGS